MPDGVLATARIGMQRGAAQQDFFALIKKTLSTDPGRRLVADTLANNYKSNFFDPFRSPEGMKIYYEYVSAVLSHIEGAGRAKVRPKKGSPLAKVISDLKEFQRGLEGEIRKANTKLPRGQKIIITDLGKLSLDDLKTDDYHNIRFVGMFQNAKGQGAAAQLRQRSKVYLVSERTKAEQGVNDITQGRKEVNSPGDVVSKLKDRQSYITNSILVNI